MGIAIPYLQKLQKEEKVEEKNQSNHQMVDNWYLCCSSSSLSLWAFCLGVPDSAFIIGRGPIFMISSITILVTGTIFAMWMGEKITDKGIGNGISLLIMVGIIASLPLSFTQEFVQELLKIMAD